MNSVLDVLHNNVLGGPAGAAVEGAVVCEVLLSAEVSELTEDVVFAAALAGPEGVVELVMTSVGSTAPARTCRS